MITVNNQALKTFLNNQNSKSILSEFKRTTMCHAFYHSPSASFNQRKPYQRKATITPRQQVFFYYLNLLSTSLQNKFNSFSKPAQKRIQQTFNKSTLTSSQQAIATITKTITATNIN